MARLFKPQPGKRRASAESTPQRLQIDDLAQDGRGVARHEGKAVFVAGGLPGETVEVAHYRRQKRFSECEVKTLLETSPQRVAPACAHYGECGGCQLQHLQAGAQLHYKQQALLALLQRQLSLPVEALEKVLQPALESIPYGYRSRVRLGVDSQRQLTFRARGSDRLVPVRQCPVLEPALEALLPPLQGWLDSLPARPGVTHIELLSGAGGIDDKVDDGRDLACAIIRHTRPLSPAALAALAQLPGLDRCWLQDRKQGPLLHLDGAEADPRLYLSLPEPGLKLAFQPQDFTQVNRSINRAMVAQALEWLALTEADRVADLFCGIGNFTLPLAQMAGRVTGVEGVESMVVRGRENAALNQCNNVDFIALDLNGESLAPLLRRQRINRVLLDPPRSGAQAVCEQMAGAAVERLVYVSCSPASFARDAAILQASGYELQALRVLDMFPQTAHMETMALFVPDEQRRRAASSQ